MNLSNRMAWDRVRALFDNSPAPYRVWERQFDGFDEKLQQLASTPQDQINFSDLWYYFHDLASVELQPELFAYLFPVCLMEWHCTLMNNLACSHGDCEFHNSVRLGNIFQKMMTPIQREGVFVFLRDSFLERLDKERGGLYAGSSTPAYAWIRRFNSLGLVISPIALCWEPWWSIATPGRAVAVLQYCSGLMYYDEDNPLFPPWNAQIGGGGPALWENDSIIGGPGWQSPNLHFLRTVLTVDFVCDRVTQAAGRLRGEPEWELAQRMVSDLRNCQELIAVRVTALPILLSTADNVSGWRTSRDV
jgi:hypothetical protein